MREMKAKNIAVRTNQRQQRYAKTPEGVIQAYATAKLKDHGCLVRKISYEGRRGCPDLIVLVPVRTGFDWCRWELEPQTIFLEIKKDEDTQPEEHQLREHQRIRQHGGDVRVIGSKRQVDRLVRELFLCN